MNKKYLYIGIIVLIIIIAIGLYATGTINNDGNVNTNGNNNANVNTDGWEIKEIAGIQFKIPEKYQKGSSLSGNIIDGQATGNSYKSNSGNFEVLIFLPEENVSTWDDQLNNFKSNNQVEVETVDNQEIQIFKNVGNDSISEAFFKVGEDKVIVVWSNSAFEGEIKAIVNSFFQLN